MSGWFPGAEPVGPGLPPVLTVARCEACLYNNVHNSIYVPSLGTIIPAKVNESLIIRSSKCKRQGVSNVPQQNAKDLQDSP